MNRSNTLLVLGAAAAGVVAVGLVLERSSSASTPAGPQNAVSPNAQDAPGGPFAAQGTLPDFGNLLSYNQAVGAALSAPQATSITSGVPGG